MSRLLQKRLTLKMAVRMTADALMISAALLVALILRYLWLVGVEGSVVSPQDTLHNYFQIYLASFWLLVLISLIVFYFSGFYTQGRFYRGHYKALAITQAVSLSHLVFSLLVFISWDVISLPRSTLFLSWFLTLTFLLSARLWSKLWTASIKVERRLLPAQAADDKIRNVLIIGGAGYIGSALLLKLLDKGYRVCLLDMLLYGTEPIQNVLNHPRLEIVQADFRQVNKVVEAMRDTDAVIHLGAIVGDPACALNEKLTVEINLMATRMIAEVAKSAGVSRFIFASTCSVYGASDMVLDESSLLNPVSLYARSKIASEKVLMKIADDRFTSVILRFGTIYGLSGRTRFDLVINLLTAKAISEGQITIFGGDQWRPFVHVDDAAMAIFKVLEAPQALVHNRIFNVGSNEQNYTIREIGEIIHRMVPTAQLLNLGSDADRRNYRVNFDKICRELGFVPRWTVEKGVQQVIAAIKSGKIQDYRDVKYSNAKFLNEQGILQFINQENGNETYEPLNDMAQLAYGMRFPPTENDWAYELIANRQHIVSTKTVSTS